MILTAALLAGLAGTWRCNATDLPRSTFQYTFHRNGTGIERQIGVPLATQRFRFGFARSNLILAWFGGAPTRDRVEMAGPTLVLIENGYWHGGSWTRYAGMDRLTCRR